MGMEIVRLCIRTTGKTLESIKTLNVVNSERPIFARAPLIALAKGVC